MLAQNPCRAQCSWSRLHRPTVALPIFCCRGCGSQWARTQAWTPVDADGTVPPEVATEAARRPTSGPTADAAGSADS